MDDKELLQETYRLAQENNRLLHKLRRAAFWSRLVSFIIYAALLIAPLWFYVQYLAPLVDQMFRSVQQFQGSGAQAGAQFTQLQQAWQELEKRFGGASSSQ